MENIIAANLNFEQLILQLTNYKQTLDSLLTEEQSTLPEPDFTVSTPPAQIKQDSESEPQYFIELETPSKPTRSIAAKRQKLQNRFKIKNAKIVKTKKYPT